MNKTGGILFLIALTLCSCGWQLRGNGTDASTKPVQLVLTSTDMYSQLYHAFKVAYEKRRIDLTPDNHAPQLKLLNEIISVRTVSLNTELDPAEDKLTLAVNYQITLDNTPAQIYKIQTDKTLIRNKNRLAAREDEQDKLLQEMRTELAERILTQIQTASTSHNAGKTTDEN